ncbi:S-layer protein [uncultured archaeon]|nr:S-layer protein [uncultured archaeon]
MYKAFRLLTVSAVLVLVLGIGIAGAAVTNTDGIEIRGTVSDENAKMYFWGASDFPAFWYDLDDNKTSETLQINPGEPLTSFDRSIDAEHLWYNATIQISSYGVYRYKGKTVDYSLDPACNQVPSGGYYAVIGWQGEKFAAINCKANKISRLILEQGPFDKKSLYMGEKWDMGDGYSLTAESMNAQAFPRQVMFNLSLNGRNIDQKVIGQGEAYTYYNNSLAGEYNVPIFVTYLDSVFNSSSTNIVQLRYTWLISSDVKEIKSGDIYGNMIVDEAGGYYLNLKNRANLNLEPGSIVNITDNFKFKIANNTSALRFYPFISKAAQDRYEARGKVENFWYGPYMYPLTYPASWNYANFAGFWYDMDDNKFTESLTIQEISGRIIPRERLWYNTTKTAIQFNVAKEENRTVEYGFNEELTAPNAVGDRYYAAVGWMGEKFVGVNGKNNKLAKLILEQRATDNMTLAAGETWDMGGGYKLKILEINTSTLPKEVHLELSKGGDKLDDRIVEEASLGGTGSQGVYTYYSNIESESNVPVLVTYVDSVFSWATSNMVRLKYTWLISQNATVIRSGDKIGIFKVDATEDMAYGLTLKSDSAILFQAGETIDLTGKMKFRVAGNITDSVRFYPFMMKTLKLMPPEVGITNPVDNSSFLHGDMIMLSGSASGMPPYNYSWTSNIDGFIGNTSKISTFSLSPGVHKLTFEVIDMNGFSNSTSVNITIYPVNETNISGQATSGLMEWNVTNFPAFWRDSNKSTESLKIISMSFRVIPNGYLWYNTTVANLEYAASREKGRNVEYGLDNSNIPISVGGKYYGVKGWFGRKYVAINGRSSKLSKLILEQAAGDEKILSVGETWDIGDGFSLKLQGIDAKAFPKQAWMTLSKGESKLDDKIIEEGLPSFTGTTQGVYTYYARRIGGENNVPVFVTYLDNVSSSSVRLKYTWLISDNIMEIRSGDKIGIFKVDAIEDSIYGLTLKSDSSVILEQGATINIADGLRFKVNDTPELQYYPEMSVISQIPTGTPVQSSTGKGIVYFVTDKGAIEDLTAINVSDIPQAPPEGANLYYGLFRFNITGVGLGGSVTLTLTFPDNLPVDTTYWKYGANATNAAPHWYIIPSTINGNTLTLTLTDGVDGDDDLAANGRIRDDSGPSIPQPLPPLPEIISWGNDKTKDGSLSITINKSETVRFNAAANQAIDTWNWFLDDVNQNNNADYFVGSFASTGTYKVKVNATNNNGTSDTITWNVDVVTPTVPLSITFVPPTPDNNSEVNVNYVNVSIMLNKPGGTVQLNWNGAVENMDGSGAVFYKNKTGLANGIYEYYVNASDAAGNFNISETRRVTVNVTAPTGGVIRGKKFNDSNRNKIKDISENGLANWTIQLRGYDTVKRIRVNMQVLTDANGDYSFTGLNPGIYVVNEKMERRWVPTTPPARPIRLGKGEIAVADFGNRRI